MNDPLFRLLYFLWIATLSAMFALAGFGVGHHSPHKEVLNAESNL